jgi:hypothetical protein
MVDGSPTARVGQGRRPRVKRPWPRLPPWFVFGAAAASFGIVVLLVLAVVRMARPEQPVEQRRTPSSATMSHDVGAVVFQDRLTEPVPCGAVTGLRVAGVTQENVDLLRELVTQAICPNLRITPLDAVGADASVAAAARRGVVIGFGQFERTGEDSTTLVEPGKPVRVAVNARFSIRGKSFKGYLAVVLLHELMHAGGRLPVTAEDELRARTAEAALCTAILPNTEIGRSCSDAQTIVGWGRETALAKLRAAGYP